MGWGARGVRPWRPTDLSGRGGFLEMFARDGEAFESTGAFKGYNEVISGHQWSSVARSQGR